MPESNRAISTSNPLHGCNSDLAQYSNTPSLRAAGFEDEDEDENEALRASHHTALNTTHELMPPKPKALLRTWSSDFWRGSFGTMSRSQAGSGVSKFNVGGM